MSSAAGPSAASEDVLVRRENGVLIITINRPQQRNAVNEDKDWISQRQQARRCDSPCMAIAAATICRFTAGRSRFLRAPP